jgi:hypothetical protein
MYSYLSCSSVRYEHVHRRYSLLLSSLSMHLNIVKLSNDRQQNFYVKFFFSQDI